MSIKHYMYAWFPPILENLENNKFIFKVLEISLNFTKSGNVLEQVMPVNKIHL